VRNEQHNKTATVMSTAHERH